VMTRTTLKALVGGGGLLATWLAVSPNQGVPATSPAADLRRQATSSEPRQLNADTARLRERRGTATLKPSTRNPFRFSAPKRATQSTPLRDRNVEPAVAPAAPVDPPSPPLTLSGIAQTSGKRTAIIAGGGQLYLVGEGESVAGLYVVVKVDPEAVLLRDASGAERRLILPQ
jgi:hypothetical protein